MGDVEFFGKVNPRPQKSLAQEFKEEQSKIIEDRERFAKYGTNNPKLVALMASGQVMSAADLVRVREEEAKQAVVFEEAVLSEQSLSRTRIPREKVKSKPVYRREPFEG